MKCQREKFRLQRKHSYINCAYMSPMLKRVEKTGINAIKKKRLPSKIAAEDFFKDTETNKLLFSQLINASDPQSIATIPSVSYALANVATNLPSKRGKIIVVDGQFPSNVYPWLRLQDQGYKVEIITKKQRSADEWNEAIFEAIDEDTSALAIGHVHWANGIKFQLKEFRSRLDDVDGLLIVDGTQSIGALPFDQSEIKADVIACAAYKWLMGPYGIGLAYYGEKFHQGVPIEENWINRKGSENFGSLVDYQSEYKEGAQRYSVGEQSNFILVPMLKEALKQVLKWTPESIQNYTGQLMRDALDQAEEIGYQLEAQANRANHLIGLSLPSGLELEKVQKVFKDKRVNVSFRGDSIRLSPHVYNDETDIRKLIGALQEAKN